ncbi:hypothetical protein RJT34_12539 [Clitoria ternatea]|uniref:GPI inositol-deacylase n=1 Tax=Clitoria ternatea TaxID=43366 RepID=A0AAN9PKU3_CLITE
MKITKADVRPASIGTLVPGVPTPTNQLPTKGQALQRPPQHTSTQTTNVLTMNPSILDQYKVSYDAQTREGAAVSRSLPKNVILVCYSMGGFVARAVVIHPHLKKSIVEIVLTLPTPHQNVLIDKNNYNVYGNKCKQEKDAAMGFVPMCFPMPNIVASTITSVHQEICVGMAFVEQNWIVVEFSRGFKFEIAHVSSC